MSKPLAPAPWTTLHSEIAFRHRWYTLRRDHVRLPTGEVIDDYFVSVRPDVALVFAVTVTGEVLFVRQYKHGAGAILLELPGGVVDAGEVDDPAAAARRELLEETGYASEAWEPLPFLVDNPTKDTNKIYPFLARDARPVGEQRLDPTEAVEVVTIPLGEVEERILRGDVQVSGSVALCLLALRHVRAAGAGGAGAGT